jgi:hypothetical protein
LGFLDKAVLAFAVALSIAAIIAVIAHIRTGSQSRLGGAEAGV